MAVSIETLIDEMHMDGKTGETIQKIETPCPKASCCAFGGEDFKTLFEKAEASRFLKGANDRNWSATFDWLITDTNMAKVLDGNYDDNKTPTKRQSQQTQPYVRESPTRNAVDANNRALARMLATED